MKTQQPAESRKSEDKGFYIILVLCLAAIAVSAYVLFWTPDKPVSVQNQPPISQVMQSDEPDEDIPDTPSETSQTSQTASVVQQTEDTPKKEDQNTQTLGKSQTKGGLVLPVKNASVLKIFSEDTLQYDVTMGDWRVHKATDYAGKVGDRIYAVGDGTVTDVSQDPLYGNCVTLDLGSDLTCRYTGLSDKIKVKKGEAVKAGALIGAIGNSNQMESQMDSHLHLEMYRGGQMIDPEEVLPQKEE